MSLHELFDLTPHNGDVYVGQGIEYPWGRLYGGHVFAQALRAAAFTSEDGMLPHSVRAYFIRRGLNAEPVRYEVERIRDGKSFCTRRVVARQDNGAILNLEASFQKLEHSPDVSNIVHQHEIMQPDEIEETSWSTSFNRRVLPESALTGIFREGAGRTAAWFRVTDSLGDDELLNQCALAYLSDDLPHESVVLAVPELSKAAADGQEIGASLDHTVWFHRPVRADQWHLYETSCLSFGGGRGLTKGFVFAQDGTHVATFSQETLERIIPAAKS